jgi:N,N'-diacetyllegionaminate synthase
MTKLADELNIQVGYSDHTPGTEVSLAAVALGATIIEKHFTLDHNMPGPDHKSSLTPNELSFLIKSIRNLEDSLGISTKTIQESELQNRILMRKSLVAKRPIRKGELLTFENMTCKRPATGISPMRIYELIGTVSKRDYNSDDLIEI